MIKNSQKTLLIFSVIFLISNSNSLAAGYSTELYSTSGLGNSYAGSAAGSHDASDMFFNPAVISEIKKKELIASLNYLDLRIDPDNGNGKFLNGYPASGKETKNAGSKSFVPAFYFATPINDKFAFGLSITSPFGLSTKYNKDWIGRYRAVESSVSTVNFNPSLSYKIDEKLSFGFGLQAQYYQATLTKSVVNSKNPYDSSYDLTGKAKGSDWGYGYNLGATYKMNDKLKFGLGYRSKIDHKLTGTTQVPTYAYSDFDAKTTTPESLTAGIAFKLNQKVELLYDTTWTRWSRLKSLTINAKNNALNIENTTNFNYRDSFLNSVGANFSLNEKWLFRTGVAYEKEAITDANREPRIPSGDKIWTSIGFSYKIKNDLTFDAAYLHHFYRSARSNLTNSSDGNNSLSIKYKTKVDVLSVAIKKEF
jgi:long-chain fatty acid transport protein